MANSDTPSVSAQSFDELERLIASELVDLDNWEDDLNDFDIYTDAPRTGATTSTGTAIGASLPAYETIDEGHGLRLCLDGKIDFHSRPQIVHLINDIRTGTAKHYDVDFTAVTAISLVGISLLALLIDTTAERKIEITLSNCQPPVYQTLCWAGLHKRVLIAPI